MTPTQVLRLSALVAVAALSACNTTGQAPAAKADAARCFVPDDVRDWESVKSTTVLLHVRGDRTYALDVFGDCSDIDWTQHIGLVNDGRRMICPYDTPTVLVPGLGGSGERRCRSISMKLLTPDEAKAMSKAKK